MPYIVVSDVLNLKLSKFPVALGKLTTTSFTIPPLVKSTESQES